MGLIKFIKATQGQYAIVDEDQFERLSKFKWQALKDGNTFYIKRSRGKAPNRTLMLMHRQLLGAEKGQLVDHLNRDGTDNRMENIRTCDYKQNSANRKKRVRKGREKYCGAKWVQKIGKWYAGIQINGKYKHLGTHLTEEAAARAYDRAAKQEWGEFASVNFEDDKCES